MTQELTKFNPNYAYTGLGTDAILRTYEDEFHFLVRSCLYGKKIAQRRKRDLPQYLKKEIGATGWGIVKHGKITHLVAYTLDTISGLPTPTSVDNDEGSREHFLKLTRDAKAALSKL